MPNDSTRNNSVTQAISELRAGDHATIRFLWDRYFERVVKLARQELHNYPRRVADEEDIAAGVMQCLCNGVDRGKFPDLQKEGNLWSLLVVLTRNKVSDLLRRHFSQKRGAGKVRGDSVFASSDPPNAASGFDQFLSEDPPPDSLAEMNEELRRFMAMLKEKQLKKIVEWKLEYYTNKEIADRLGIAISTVERKLKQIREIWLEEVE